MADDYDRFRRFHAAMMGEPAPGMGVPPTAFVGACIEKAISILERYFPEDAALLRMGEKCITQAHSPNGWMTRPMGEMIHSVERAVAEMRNPHPTSTEHRRAIHAYLCIVGLQSHEIRALSAWSREWEAQEDLVGWLKSLSGCPEVA